MIDRDIIKIIGDQFIYNARSGRCYEMGRYTLEALRQALLISHQPMPVEDETVLEEARTIVSKMISAGLFSNDSFKGYVIPSSEEINSPDFGLMTIQVTEKCNLRCSYCPYSSSDKSQFRKHSERDMPIEIADMALKFFYKYASNDTAIGFYGGEPFLNFNLVKYIISELRKYLPDWSGIPTVTTNFTQYTPEIGDFLAEHDFLSVISLDGPQSLHDRYRKTVNGKDTFERVIANLIDLNDRHPDYFKNRISINTVLAPPFDLDAINEFFAKGICHLKFSDFRFSVANDLNPTFFPSINGGSANEANGIVSEYLANKLRSCQSSEDVKNSPLLFSGCIPTIKRIMNVNLPNEKDHLNFRSCIPGDKIMVHIDGSISICDKCETLKIGDIRTGIDKDLAKKLVNDWQAVLGDNCLTCWASGFCSACYAAAWDGQKLNADQLNRYCEDFRRKTEKWLEIYLTIFAKDPGFFSFINNSDEDKKV
jgi:uncharacterized protein